MGFLLLAVVFWIGVFAPLGSLGQPVSIEPSGLKAPQLFLLHAFLLLTLSIWYLAAFGIGGTAADGSPQTWSRQFGLRAAIPVAELGLGLVSGVLAWAGVVLTLIVIGLGLWVSGKSELLPEEVPPIVPWLVSLPLSVRLLVSVSAGFVEELFFRGFLQPRVGIPFSTALFVLAHLSYEQPFMLLGITILSLLFAFLVRWRQNIWAAVAAHTVFDAIQLTIMIPWALEHLGGGDLPILGLNQ
jgi:membrane protease YdiL (CAAX protease family)